MICSRDRGPDRSDSPAFRSRSEHEDGTAVRCTVLYLRTAVSAPPDGDGGASGKHGHETAFAVPEAAGDEAAGAESHRGPVVKDAY